MGSVVHRLFVLRLLYFKATFLGGNNEDNGVRFIDHLNAIGAKSKRMLSSTELWSGWHTRGCGNLGRRTPVGTQK